MFIDKWNLAEENYDDLRFGVVNIYAHKQTQDLIMHKKKRCSNYEDYEEMKKASFLRMQLNHENLLRMMHFDFDDNNFSIDEYY